MRLCCLTCLVLTAACAPARPEGVWRLSNIFEAETLILRSDGTYRWAYAGCTFNGLDQGRWHRRDDGCVTAEPADPVTYAPPLPSLPPDATEHDRLNARIEAWGGTRYGAIDAPQDGALEQEAMVLCPRGHDELVVQRPSRSDRKVEEDRILLRQPVEAPP